MPRVIAWFSCGIPSLVNAKLCVNDYDAVPVYCNSFAEENPDNRRFFSDAEKWLGRKIEIISSDKFASPTEVFEKRKYMSGPMGAPCTVELKKVPRFKFQQADDTHAWGYHVGEEDRAAEFVKHNPELINIFPLIERGLTKKDCAEIIHRAGIKEPAAYQLGFDHNNCMGCVKATSPKYWNRVRTVHPATFASRAEQSRRIGCRLVKVNGERVFLDELAPHNQEDLFENISCGPQCIAEVA